MSLPAFPGGEAVDRLAGVLQAPLFGEARIVGDRVDAAQAVRFGDRDGGVFGERRRRVGGAFARLGDDQLEVRIAEFAAVGDAGVGAGFDPFGAIAAAAPLDDHAGAQRGGRGAGGVAAGSAWTAPAGDATAPPMPSVSTAAASVEIVRPRRPNSPPFLPRPTRKQR